MRAGSVVARSTRHLFGVGLQALLIAAIVGTTALAMSAVYRPAGLIAGVEDAAAARGGKHALRSAATLVASCGPCAAGADVRISGVGFDGSAGKATLQIAGGWTSTPVAPDGSFSFIWPYFQKPGEHVVRAYQPAGNKLALVAELIVEVK